MSENPQIESPGGDIPLRRPSTRMRQFAPRPVADGEDEAVVLQRNVLRSAQGSAAKPQTDRRHVVAGDLPDWEPLPPGELFLKRPAGR